MAGTAISAVGLTGLPGIPAASRMRRIAPRGDLSVRDLTLQHGRTEANGGAVQNSGQLTGVNVTFLGNFGKHGGGLWNGPGSSADLSQSLFRHNHAVFGGAIGIAATAGALYIAFSLGTSGLTMRNNRATDDGGAIYIAASVHPVSFGPPVQLAHDVIYDNQAFNPIDDRVGRGGGIYNATGNAALVTVGNNDITRNFLDNCEPAGSVPECTG
jgi:predicted outer membrane repeat protein